MAKIKEGEPIKKPLDGAGLFAAHKAVAAHYPGCNIGNCRMGCACYQHARDAVEAYLKTTSGYKCQETK